MSRSLLIWIVLLTVMLSGYTWKRKGRQGKVKPQTQSTLPPPYLFLARRALRKKNTSYAVRALRAARQCWNKRQTACGFQYADYRALEGVLYLELGKHKEAVVALQDSAKYRPEVLTTWFYLGQVQTRLKQYRLAAASLLRALSVGQTMPGYHLLLARSQRLSGQCRAARRSLLRGLARFPMHPSLLQEGAQLLIQLQLQGAAAKFGRQLAAVSRSSALSVFLSAADSLRQRKLLLARLPILEQARLLAPGHPDVLRRLAFAYAQANRPMASGQLLARLSLQQPGLAYAAAQQFLTAGNYRLARRWNRRAPVSVKRTTQAAMLFLAEERYHRAILLLSGLWKRGKLGPTMRYRLAYIAIRVGDFGLAQRVLKSLRKTSMSGAATRLQGVLKRCLVSPWSCY